MSVLDDRLATVTHLRGVSRTAPAQRNSQAPNLHARLVAESNRLLDTAQSTEMTARDALGFLVGALINLESSVPGSVLPQDLLDVVARTADRLGCPPAAPVKAARRAR